MSNRNRNMRQVYFMRRLVAIIILVLILLLIFRACSKRSDQKKEEGQRTQENQIIEENNPNVTIPDDNQTSRGGNIGRDQDDRSNRQGDNQEDTDRSSSQSDDEEDQDTDTEDDEFDISGNIATKQVALESQIEEMEEDFVDYGSIRFNELDNAIEVELEGDFKDLVDRVFENKGTNRDQEDWDIFKQELIVASETVTEEVEHGIEFKVVNPGGMTEIVLSIKDGSVTFDLVED